MSTPVNQHISGLTVREGGKLFAGYNNTTNNIYNVPPKLLPYSTKAAFNAFGKDEDLCLPGTRVNILNQIRAWIDGNDVTNVFWLSGWAGTGKSVIARTISREYYDKGQQGKNFFASFFFSRAEEDVSDACKFATSIAMQLANSPVLRDRIHGAMLDDDKIANKILYDQWKKLVIEPLSKLDTKPVRATLVLVIDALDECDKLDDIQRVIQLLANAGALQTVRLRVLLTSRPETNIRHGYSQFLRGVYQELILHNISKSIVDNDILTFLNHKFEHPISTGWPGEEDIKRLVQKAGGLFIWAETAYRFIYGDRRFILPIAKQRLHIILQSDRLVTKPEDELNKIYITVLKNFANHDYDEEEKKKVYGMLRKILGSIVLLFSPLSADSLASLINFSTEDLRQTLDYLHSILEVPKERAYPIRLHHPSFRDFLLDSNRCTDRQLQVAGDKTHWALANSCIRIMSAMLQRDICNLCLPGTLAAEVPENKIEQYLPGELQYACSYWVQHFQESKSPLLDNGEVHLFLRKHLLFWLEALSLLRKVSEGIIALISLENLVKVDQSPFLYAFIHDAKRFSLNFRHIIEQAPLQIYFSALLFAPEKCLVRKDFKSQMPKWITGVTGGQKYWSPALQTLEGHSNVVFAVAFSPDGKLVASASRDRTARLWDSSTGAALQTLEGHPDEVYAVVFSPDGKLVASASYGNTVRLWDSSTGAALQTLEGHPNSVDALVLSPDGKLVASKTRDKTIRLWDLSTGATLQTTEGHSHSVYAVVFSPDGKLVASASGDKTVRLWDSSTGAALQTREGHSHSVFAVVFSPDGKLIASASRDRTIRLWDSSTGAALQTLEGHSGSIYAVVFSPDGKLVASASYNNTLRLWGSSTGAAVKTLKGHSKLVCAIVFSPDGKLVASASLDNTVRFWDSSTGVALQTLEGHSREITAIVFSPDGKLIASASYDNTARLWDPTSRAVSARGYSSSVQAVVNWITGVTRGQKYWSPALQTVEGHSGEVLAVVFSPDGKLVASASKDKTFRLWDSSTGAALWTLEGHSGEVYLVVFSRDSKLIASASRDKTIRLWDLSTGAALQTLEGHSNWVLAVVFSPDGKLVASASRDRTVRLWNPSTGAALQTLQGHLDWVDVVVFSPDGKLIASASRDLTIKLWDSSTGAALQTLRSHSYWAVAMVFSPDGKLIASASRDNTVRLWDLSTGAELQTFETPVVVRRLSFSHDRSYLETDIGLLSLQPASSNACSSQPAIARISLQDRWIVGSMGNLLWLPPDYQASCSDVQNSSIVLGHPSGDMSFIQFDLCQL